MISDLSGHIDAPRSLERREWTMTWRTRQDEVGVDEKMTGTIHDYTRTELRKTYDKGTDFT